MFFPSRFPPTSLTTAGVATGEITQKVITSKTSSLLSPLSLHDAQTRRISVQTISCRRTQSLLLLQHRTPTFTRVYLKHLMPPAWHHVRKLQH